MKKHCVIFSLLHRTSQKNLYFFALLFHYHIGIGPWDSDTELPPLPNWQGNWSPPSNASEIAYTEDNIKFYLKAQKKVSDALVQMSPAFWDSVYLQNYEGKLHVISLSFYHTQFVLFNFHVFIFITVCFRVFPNNK